MLELGTCVATQIDENGFYGVQIDGLGGADAAIHFEQLSHSYGFFALPLDPVGGIGCSLFRWNQRRRRHTWLADDPRIASKIPPIKKGGSCQYASDGSFASFDPETHTWTLYVPYASTPTAKAHLVTVGKDGNGKPIVEFASGEGPSFTILDKVTTIKNASGSAYSVLDDNGHTFVGPFKAAGGADIGGPTSVPLTKHPALAAALAALEAALTSLGGIPANAAASTQLGAAVAALQTLATGGGTLTTKGA